MTDFKTTQSARWAFAMALQQTAYGTALTPELLTDSYPCEALDLMEKTPKKIDNTGQSFNGTQYPTETKTIQMDTNGKRKFRASSRILAYMAALATGNIVVTQPAPVEAPNVYQYTIKPLKVVNPAFNLQLPVFSIIEELYPGKQALYRDLLVEGLTLTGMDGVFATLEANLVGSGFFQTSSITMPEPMSNPGFLFNHKINFKYNNTDISPTLKKFSWKFQNLLTKDDGYYCGSPEMTIGDQEIQVRGRLLKSGKSDESSASFNILLDPNIDIEGDNFKNIERDVNFTCEGPIIQGEYRHKAELKLPAAIIDTSKIGDSNGLYAWDCNVKLHEGDDIDAQWELVITTDVPLLLDFPA